MLRFFYIWFTLSKFLFLFVLIKVGLSKRDKLVLMKEFFETAGGSFIKFGQLMALRLTTLPEEFSIQMLDLLDNYKPFSYSYVKEVFMQDLGVTPDKVFKDFQEKPFASASFGQVHAAKLADDTVVAVKIRRPGIEEQVKIDFFIVDILAYIADNLFPMKALPWREFAREFKKWTREELDYHTEADNLERMGEKLGKKDRIVVPKVYRNYSTRRILVDEYIEGVHLSRVLRGLKDGRLTYESLLEMGIDLKKVPRILVYELLHHYFYFGFFHADPHAGNIILLPNNKVALIDFGIVGKTVPVDQHEFVLMMKSIGDMNYKEGTYHMAQISGVQLREMIQSAFPASVDQSRVDEFMRLLTDHLSEAVEKTVRGSHAALKEKKKDYAQLFLDILRTAENYQARLPREITIFVKALSTISIMCKEMDREFYIDRVINQFFKENREEDFLPYQGRQPYHRISRERAIDQLHNWLALLIETDPATYELVNRYIKKYNLLNNG